MSKYQRVFKYLYTATVNNLSEKQGGSKQTIELYNMAVEEYNKTLSEGPCFIDTTASSYSLVLCCSAFPHHEYMYYSYYYLYSYHVCIAIESKGADKAMSKAKMLKDPEFEKIVKKVFKCYIFIL